MYCYLNLRNVIADLVPVPGAHNAFLARDAPPGSPAAVEAERKLKERTMRKVSTPLAAAADGDETHMPRYHWPWLDGRYLYIATGRTNVARHMAEMGGAATTTHPDSQDEVATRTTTAAAASGPEETEREPKSTTTTARPRRRSLPTLDEGKLGAWDMLKRIEDRVEKAEAERAQPGKREEELMRRALGFEPKELSVFPLVAFPAALTRLLLGAIFSLL